MLILIALEVIRGVLNMNYDRRILLPFYSKCYSPSKVKVFNWSYNCFQPLVLQGWLTPQNDPRIQVYITLSHNIYPLDHRKYTFWAKKGRKGQIQDIEVGHFGRCWDKKGLMTRVTPAGWARNVKLLKCRESSYLVHKVGH